MFIYPCYALSRNGQTTKRVFDSEEKAVKWCEIANEAINSIEFQQVEQSIYEPIRDAFLRNNDLSDIVTGFAWEKKILE